MKLIKLMIGKKYGRLTVQEKANTRSQYRCKCDCGAIVIARASHILTRKQSCGCLREDTARRMGLKWGKVNGGKLKVKLAPGIDSAHRLQGQYRHDARRRGLGFDLTTEEFIKLTSSNCHYCGQSPSKVFKGREKNPTNYVYSGIDRINNLDGYSIKNTVSCCFDCNRAKHTRSHDDFIAWVKRIAARFS